MLSTFIYSLYSVLSDGDKWKEEGIFKNFIAHASFTVLAFPVELYLAARSLQCINAISLSRSVYINYN